MYSTYTYRNLFHTNGEFLAYKENFTKGFIFSSKTRSTLDILKKTAFVCCRSLGFLVKTWIGWFHKEPGFDPQAVSYERYHLTGEKSLSAAYEAFCQGLGGRKVLWNT